MAAISRTSQTPTIYSGAVDRVVVGDRILKNLLERALKDLPFNVQLYPRLSFKNNRNHYFCRDTQVTRVDGSLLFPYPLSPKLLQEKFLAMLPYGSDHWLTKKKMSYSCAFTAKHREDAIDYARNRGLYHRKGRSVIEGGNCFVFKSPDGISKAIIGSHSVLLTYFSLCQQDFFRTNQAQLDIMKAEIETPCDEAVRQARNFNLYHEHRHAFALKLQELEDKKLDEKAFRPLVQQLEKEFEETFPGGDQRYRDLLLAPVTSEDRQNYRDAAIKMEAEMIMTRIIMAEELHIDLRNIAVVDQNFFHIDMFLFPIGNTVFLHDEIRSREAIDRLIFPGTLKGAELGSLQNYRKASEERSKEMFIDYTVKQLEVIGCNVVKVAGLFEAPGEKTLNFMNGLLLGNLFLSNGCRFERLQRIFASALKLNAPHPLDVRFLDVDERIGYMTEFNTRYLGAIHCLTLVHPSPQMVHPSPHTAISFNPRGQKLKPELELWELNQLGELRDVILSYIDFFSTESCSEDTANKRLTLELLKKM